MIRTSLLAGLAILCGAGAAHAADVVEAAPVADWTGFYLGVHGGYGGGKFDYPMTLSGLIINDRSDNLDLGADITAGGFFGGLQAGWNWQMNENIVLGVEGDISKSNIKGELGLHVDDPLNLNIDAGSTVDWFGTARARAGFLATPDFLIYATGGLAWGSVTAHYDLDQLGGSDDETTDHMGWTLGGGVEYAINDHLSLKTEYLYVDLGKENLLDTDFGTQGEIKLNIDQDIAFHTVRAGLNYRF